MSSEPDSPAASTTAGERDGGSELDLQVRLEEIERTAAFDPLRWLLLALAVLTSLVLMPQSTTAGAAVFTIAAVGVTGVGFFQIRRGQRRDALESALARHRRRLLEEAETPAHRLAILHEDLDRLRARPTGTRGLILSLVATVLFVLLGLAEGIAWVSFTGVFFGLMSAFRFTRVRERRRAERDLLEKIAPE